MSVLCSLSRCVRVGLRAKIRRDRSVPSVLYSVLLVDHMSFRAHRTVQFLNFLSTVDGILMLHYRWTRRTTSL